jgi:hypothetical protein
MAHSGSYLEDLRVAGGVARRMAFDLVVALDFYDGPENGFAFHSSGEGLRFSVVAESKVRLFRAFTFTLLCGNWTEMIKKVVDTSLVSATSRMVFAFETDDGISALVASAREAKEQSYYVGVGSAYLDNLAITAISKADIDNLMGSKHYGDYTAIHRYIKASGGLVPGSP